MVSTIYVCSPRLPGVILEVVAEELPPRQVRHEDREVADQDKDGRRAHQRAVQRAPLRLLRVAQARQAVGQVDPAAQRHEAGEGQGHEHGVPGEPDAQRQASALHRAQHAGDEERRGGHGRGRDHRRHLGRHPEEAAPGSLPDAGPRPRPPQPRRATPWKEDGCGVERSREEG